MAEDAPELFVRKTIDRCVSCDWCRDDPRAAELQRKPSGGAVGRIGDAFDCCGLGGIMGFRKKFHPTSVAIGRRLRDKVVAAAPQTLLTDCLSCRLQFERMAPTTAAHPVQILREAYRSFGR